MTLRLTIYTEPQLQLAIGTLRKAWAEHRYLRVTYSDSKPRSLSQNSQAAVWYEQISRETAEYTTPDVKCICKLHYGVPILRMDDDEFRANYDATIKHLTYEQKLQAMRLLPVTSLMSTDQLSRYLEQMQKGYEGKVELLFLNEESRA